MGQASGARSAMSSAFSDEAEDDEITEQERALAAERAGQVGANGNASQDVWWRPVMLRFGRLQ